MNKLIQALAMSCAVVLGAFSVVWAAADPVIGSWTISLEKSEFHPGGAPKSMTRTYSASAGGIELKVAGVTPDGNAFTQTTTLTYDGKDCQVTGSPQYDAFALTRVNEFTVRSQIKKGGVIVGTSTSTVSANGSVLTLNTFWKGANGATNHDRVVFEKKQPQTRKQ